MSLDFVLLAALSEGQRSVGHLVVVLGVVAALAAVGLVRVIRRKARRRDGTIDEKQRTPEDVE